MALLKNVFIREGPFYPRIGRMDIGIATVMRGNSLRGVSAGRRGALRTERTAKQINWIDYSEGRIPSTVRVSAAKAPEQRSRGDSGCGSAEHG